MPSCLTPMHPSTIVNVHNNVLQKHTSSIYCVNVDSIDTQLEMKYIPNKRKMLNLNSYMFIFNDWRYNR
jgi:hypothetical protein